jgi:hypothetical protein
MSEDQLKTEELTILECDHLEMNRYIKHHYCHLPSYWHIAKISNWEDGACYHHHVIKRKLEDYEEEDLASFKEDGTGASLEVLLTDLCNRNILNPGIYVVRVDW